MGYKARWGPMGFLVSPTKIVPFDDLSTTISVKSDSGSNASGSSNNRGRELQGIQFTTQYLRAVGVDPLKKFEEWSELVGKSNPLYIGEKRFGPSKMTLKSVAISDSILSTEGVFLSLTLTISLEENPTSGTTKSSKTSSKSKSKKEADKAAAKKAAETYAKTVEKKKAMQATAQKDERKDKL